MCKMNVMLFTLDTFLSIIGKNYVEKLSNTRVIIRVLKMAKSNRDFCRCYVRCFSCFCRLMVFLEDVSKSVTSFLCQTKNNFYEPCSREKYIEGDCVQDVLSTWFPWKRET